MLLLVAAHGEAATAKSMAKPARALPLSVDLASVTELFPNQSVSGSVGALSPRYFKVFANRSLASPETLAITLEATGALFGSGWLSVLDPEQLLLDERFTRAPGDLNVSTILVPETGYYLLIVESDQAFDWSVTANLTVNASAFLDNDNDLGNASLLTGDSGALNGSVTDPADLTDQFAIDLRVYGARQDALLVNLTSPNLADLDVYLFHIVGGLAVIDGSSTTPTGIENAAALATANQTYFIRVLSYAGSSNYTMVWARLNVSADDNSDAAHATPIGSGFYLNNLSRWDTLDLFRLDVPQNTTVNVSLHTEGFNATTRTPDLQAVLFDAGFARVTWSFTFDPDERIDALLATAGTYYLDIYGADITYYLTTSLTFNYTMQVVIDPPPALADPAWNTSFAEDTVAVVDLRAVVPTDPASESLVFSVDGASPNVTASLDADGFTLRVVPAPDWSGPAWVMVGAADAWQRSELNLPLAVLPVNDPPRLKPGADKISFDEDSSAFFDFASELFDPEGDAFSILSAAPEAPLSASAVAGGLNLSAPPNFNGMLHLVLSVQDAAGGAANLTVEVTIRAVNDAPFFVRAPGPFVFQEDATAQNATFDLTGLAADPDGDAVGFSMANLPSISVIIVGTAVSFYAARDFWGNVSAVLVASDGRLTASATVVIAVLPVDDPPIVVLPFSQPIAHEGSSYTFTVTADDPDTSPLALRFSFWLDGVLIAENQSTGSVTHAFGYEDAGLHVMRVVVSDGELASAADATVVVAATNRAPQAQILTPRNLTFRSGESIPFSARALDPDGTPVNITWIVDGTAVSSSPTFSLDGLAVGHHTVVLRVFDGDLASFDTTAVDVQGGLAGFDLPAALAAVCALVLLSRRRRPE